ncbi:MAG: hypothetical protein ACR2KV_04945 [Solirubrobacteraceae bacterium]
MRLSLALKIRQRWICPGRIFTVGSIAPLMRSGVKRSFVSATGMTWPGKLHGSLPLVGAPDGPGAESGNATDSPSLPHSSVLWIIISRCGTPASTLSSPPSTTIAPESPAKICGATSV